MTRQVDVAIIGAGSAGLSALGEVKKKTENFVLINSGFYGTTCARVACMPTKALIEAANTCHRRHQMKHLGVSGTDALAIDKAKIMEHVKTMRDGFTSGIIKGVEKLGDKSITGHARFRDPHTIEVEGEIIKTGKTIIATGSRPVFPEKWKRFGDRMITTDDLFYLDDLPASMAVLGLGPAGLELAQALARLDIAVTAVEMFDYVGGLSDPEVNKKAIEAIGKEFALHCGVAADFGEADNNKIKMTFGGKEAVVDKVLLTAGRIPNIDRIGMENLGVALDERGMPSYNRQTMQIADLPVFIAGDANGFRPLLHEAIDEGHIAGYNAMLDEPVCFTRRVPLAITFSDPEIVLVGKRYAELKDNADFVIGEYDFSQQSRARMSESNKGCVRIYAEKASGLLCGAEMAAPGAEHLGHFLALALQNAMTVHDLLITPVYHPVFEEGFRTALRDLGKKIEQKFTERDLLLCNDAPPKELC